MPQSFRVKGNFSSKVRTMNLTDRRIKLFGLFADPVKILLVLEIKFAHSVSDSLCTPRCKHMVRRRKMLVLRKLFPFEIQSCHTIYNHIYTVIFQQKTTAALRLDRK